MNLELPFYELPDAELDAYLERIDQELDALFLGEVSGSLPATRTGVDADADAAAA